MHLAPFLAPSNLNESIWRMRREGRRRKRWRKEGQIDRGEVNVGGRIVEAVRSNGGFDGGGMVVKNTSFCHDASVISNKIIQPFEPVCFRIFK